MAPRLRPSRIPIPRSSSTATATSAHTFKSATDYPAYDSDSDMDPTSEDERRRAALSIRLTCSTPTFNQSNKFSKLAACDAPASPMMHRGEGICNLPRYTDYKENGSPLSLNVSRSLNRKPSRLARLRRCLSRSSLRSGSDGSSDGQSSRSSSPGTLSSTSDDKSISPMFSRCTSPIDEYYNDTTPTAEVPPPVPPKFKIRRKPVPEYIPDALGVPSLDYDSSSATSSDDAAEECGVLQNVGPNVFIAYDDDSTFALMTAFTHVVRLSHAEATPPAPSDVEFLPETGLHIMYLPIPSPWPTTLPDPIRESHRDIQFTSSLPTPSAVKKSRRRRAIAGPPPPSPTSTTSERSLILAKALTDELHSPVRPFSRADLVATQAFLAASSGRAVSLPELAYFLSDDPLALLPAAPPLGLQVRHIDTLLSFLRPHPFAPAARRRVLLMASRGQLAREGLALMACYLARTEGWSLLPASMCAPQLSVFRKDTEALALVSEEVISDELFRVSVNSASIAFLVGEQPHAVGTGAAICLSYEFNQDVADCPENTSIATWASLPLTLLKDIADYLQPAPGDLIRCRFRTLPAGGFDIFNATRADLLPDTPITGSAPFPAVSMEQLYRTFTIQAVSDVRLHLVSIGPSGGEQLLFKTTRYYAAELLEDARFMASLPHKKLYEVCLSNSCLDRKSGSSNVQINQWA
ncbi:hypothetical protein C8R46DRAFT_1048480 [Mycena filopes]|nr:hypothetical protein C8R46DRAFT_1048480 [Mycena filopes]